MSEQYRQYRDYGCGSFYRLIQTMPDLDTDEFEEFVVIHNRADCDSGELENISTQEMGRLAADFRLSGAGRREP